MTAQGHTESKHMMLLFESKIQTIYWYIFKCPEQLEHRM